MSPYREPTTPGEGAQCEVWGGKVIDIEHFRPEDVGVEWIAHHLAATNRYNGATAVQMTYTRAIDGFVAPGPVRPRPLSVAEHSYRVSRFLRDEMSAPVEIQLAGLFHDAAEALLGDMISPVKYQTECGEPMRALEQMIMEAVASAIGFSPVKPAEVTVADTVMLWLEVDALMPSGGRTWKGWEQKGKRLVESYYQGNYRETLRKARFDQAAAAALFIEHYERLKEERDGEASPAA